MLPLIVTIASDAAAIAAVELLRSLTLLLILQMV